MTDEEKIQIALGTYLPMKWREYQKLRAEGYKRHKEAAKLYAEGYALSEAENKLYKAGVSNWVKKLYEAGRELYKEAWKLRDVGWKLREEGKKLLDKRYRLYKDAVKEVYGDREVEINWDTGEVEIL